MGAEEQTPLNGRPGDGGMSRRASLGLLLAGVAATQGTTSARAADAAPAPDDGLPRGLPSAQGVDAATVVAFLDEADRAGFEIQGFMAARGGKVVAEGWWSPYRPDLLHAMHSLTKSVTVSAVGLAVADGRFKLTDRVVSFFPEHLPPQVGENLALMTVEDLLTMRTGQADFVSGAQWRPIKTSWVAEFFKIPVPYKPGTTFVYTSAATFMLSAIISKTTGSSTEEYLRTRLFQPLGISGYTWAPGPEGISPGANGLSWKTSDSLKLAMLYAQGGAWEGRQLLPREWVEAAITPHVPGKYGYQWWIGPNGAAYASGMFFQYAVVFPKQNAALSFTSGIPRRSNFDKLVFKYFPAAFEKAGDPGDDARLAARLRDLRLLPAPRRTGSPVASAASGKTFNFGENADRVRSIRVDFSDDAAVFTMVDDRGTHEIKVGLGRVVEGATTMTGHYLHHEYQPASMVVAASGEWRDRWTFAMTWSFIETGFRDTAVCRFEGLFMRFDRSVNVNYAATERPTLTGTLANGPYI